MSKTFEEVKKLGVTGIDMESSCILTLGRLMGVKTCILTVVTVLENLKETLKGQDRVDAEDLLCRTALEGIYNYHIKREDGYFKFTDSNRNGALPSASDNSWI